MGLSAVTYALAKGYTDQTAAQFGGLKGANCKVKSITPSADGTYNTVVFEWKNDAGATQTSSMIVYNGNITDVNPLLDQGIKIAEITLNDGTVVELYAPEGGSDAELSAAMTTTKAVGGVNVGKNYSVGTSLETIIRDILAPTLYPTFTNPSATISATGDKLLEAGSSLNTTMTITFNQGSINPAYGTSGKRAGAASSYALNGGSTQSGNTFSVTVTSSQLTYQGSVNYAAGPQPKDSAGNNYSTPLPAGSVDTNTITYEFVDALWSNHSNIATVAKMGLVSKTAKQKDITFPAQTASNPEIFDIPASWTVTAIQVKNDLSGNFEDASDQFTISNVTHDNAAGDSVNYKRYTFNLGYDTGSRVVRIKWS